MSWNLMSWLPKRNSYKRAPKKKTTFKPQIEQLETRRLLSTAQLWASTFAIDEDAGSFLLTITLDQAVNDTITVSYGLGSLSDTATEDIDFDPPVHPDDIQFAPYETVKTRSVTIIDDDVDESNETFTFFLYAISGATTSPTLGSPATLTVTINDDDPEPTVSLSAPASVNENIGNADMTATLSGPSASTITVNYSTSDGTALDSDYDYAQTTGTLTFSPGMTVTTFYVAINDDSKDEPDEDFGVQLSNPSNASLGTPISASVTIIDNDDPPTVTLSIESVYEDAGYATVSVYLQESGKTITLSYATSDGTAKAASDFTDTDGSLSISPGTTYTTFLVPITDDSTDEEDEYYFFNTSNVQNAALGSPATQTATIFDDDDPPDAYLTTTTYSVSEDAGSVSIYVELSAESEKTVTVDYYTSDGTAFGGEGADYDYSPTSDTLTFNPGETSKYFTVPITNDSIDEDPQIFEVALMSAGNATLANPYVATVTIIDDDGPPAVSLSSDTYNVGEDIGEVSITATLSAASEKTITVNYATDDIDAEVSSDYSGASGQLAFYPGETISVDYISVWITDDSIDENTESLKVTLSSPTNATLGTSLATITIIDNDDPPTVEFSWSSQSVSENVGTTSVTLQLSNESGKDITVPVSIGGDADIGDDYSIKPIPLTITLTAGTTASVIPIEIYKDLLVEKDEDIVLTLGSPTNATLGSTTTHTATISGNYAPPTIPTTPNNNLGGVDVDYNSGDIIIDHPIDIPPGGG